MIPTNWANRRALYHPNKIALKEYETQRTLTYDQLNRLGNRLAYHLKHEFGVSQGERVVVLAENCLEYVVLFVAAQNLGFILVPLNYRLTGSELNFMLTNTEPKVVIIEEKFYSQIATAPNFSDFKNWSLSALSKLCDSLQATDKDDYQSGIKIQADDPIFILFTSGTTGFPKGALYTHKMLFWNSINTSLSLLVNTESRTINCMPPFHTGGWNVLLTPFLHHGGYTCLLKNFSAATVLELLQTESPTIFMGVPTMLKMIVEETSFAAATFTSLYYIIVGGEPMPIPLIECWQAKGVMIRQGYGMTEVGPNLTSLHQSDAIRKKGSIGRPNFYVQTKIADVNGIEVAPNTTGELLLKGEMVTPGYWQNDVATQKAIKSGWFHTGDLVRCDDEGYLYVVDRIKNMFISGGENVYPAEIERVIESHPHISEVAVVGIKNVKWGEVGKAFIVKQEEVSIEQVKSFCLERLAKFKVPKEFVLIDELPKNDTGKINRQALMRL